MNGAATSSPRAPSVTVVIAFRDEERFLELAIDSVRSQSIDDWELVLVDDGSRDRSRLTADDAAAADRRIRVVDHGDGRSAGIPASRNLGLAAAAAPYVCFLDADDRWSPEKLARQRGMLATHADAAMVCGPAWHRHLDASSPAELVPVSARGPGLVRRGVFPRLMVTGKVRTPPPSDVMYRVDVLRDVGGVPRGPNMHEDQRTYVAVGLAGAVLVDDEPLTTYTIRPESVFGSQRLDGMALVHHHLAFERWVVRHAARRGPHGLAVVVALLVHRLRRGLRRRVELAAGRRRHGRQRL